MLRFSRSKKFETFQTISADFLGLFLLLTAIANRKAVLQVTFALIFAFSCNFGRKVALISFLSTVFWC